MWSDCLDRILWLWLLPQDKDDGAAGSLPNATMRSRDSRRKGRDSRRKGRAGADTITVPAQLRWRSDTVPTVCFAVYTRHSSKLQTHNPHPESCSSNKVSPPADDISRFRAGGPRPRPPPARARISLGCQGDLAPFWTGTNYPPP